MALNSTSRRRYGALLAASVTGAVAAIIGLASPASAHDDKVTAWCKDDTTTLRVELWAYRDEKPNTVEVTVDDEVLLEKTDFGRDFEQEWEFPGDVDYTFHVVVEAWDGDEYNVDETLTVEACVETPTTQPTSSTSPTSSTTVPQEPTTPSEEPTTSSSTPEPTVTSTTTPAAPPTTEVDSDDLAETGASVGLPLGIAGVLLAGGVVLLFVVRRRSRA